MKVKTRDLSGRALDWAVCKALGAKGLRLHTYTTYDDLPPVWVVDWERDWVELADQAFSTDWHLAGPIIEEQWISVYPYIDHWAASHRDTGSQGFGETPLIAAMRCFVRAKLGKRGDEVEIPDELR